MLQSEFIPGSVACGGAAQEQRAGVERWEPGAAVHQAAGPWVTGTEIVWSGTAAGYKALQLIYSFLLVQWQVPLPQVALVTRKGTACCACMQVCSGAWQAHVTLHGDVNVRLCDAMTVHCIMMCIVRAAVCAVQPRHRLGRGRGAADAAHLLRRIRFQRRLQPCYLLLSAPNPSCASTPTQRPGGLLQLT